MEYEDNALYPNTERPTVSINGKEVNHLNEKIKGKSLEVYQFLVENPGNHGIREIQRELDYTSPSIASYHIKRLLKAKMINKTNDNQYYAIKDEIMFGDIGTHINFLSYWIPRSLAYGITILIISVFAIVLILEGLTNIFDEVLFFSIICFIGLVLVYDAVHLSMKFSS